MKHLSLHQTEQDFLLDELDAFPHVSYIEETEAVEYIPEITTGGIGDIYYMPAGGDE